MFSLSCILWESQGPLSLFCTGFQIKRFFLGILLRRIVVFCSWTSYFTLTMPLSPQDYKWLGGVEGGTLTSIPSRGERKYSWSLWVPEMQLQLNATWPWTDILFKFVFYNQFLITQLPLFPFLQYKWPQRLKRLHDGCICGYLK